MPEHSKIGASKAHIWMACPGSVRLSAGLEQVSSEAAEEGTAAHELARRCLAEVTPPETYLGQTINGFDVTEEMVDAVAVYLDVLAKSRGADDWFEFECRFDLSHLYPGLFGTADAVVYSEATRTLQVIDFKYGRNVPVEAEANPQLLYYALGAASAAHNRPLKEVVLTIVQPRCVHKQGPVRRTTISAFDLLSWSEDLVEAAKRTTDANAALVTGEHCRWCVAKAICPAANDRQAQARAAFAPLRPYDAGKLAVAIKEAAYAKAWAKSVEDFALAEAKAGVAIPGHKLVQTLGTRKWVDDQVGLELALRSGGLDPEDFTDTKLKSPTAIEKLVGKKEFAAMFAEFVTRSQGVTLAPEDDPRPSAKDSAKDAFGENVT